RQHPPAAGGAQQAELPGRRGSAEDVQHSVRVPADPPLVVRHGLPSLRFPTPEAPARRGRGGAVLVPQRGRCCPARPRRGTTPPPLLIWPTPAQDPSPRTFPMSDSFSRSTRGVTDPRGWGMTMRAWSKASGFDDIDLARPIVGILQSWSELNHCHIHFRQL